MTTLITRLYSSVDQAEAAASALAVKKFPSAMMSIVSGESDSSAARQKIVDAGVYPAAAATYATKVAAGNALLILEAGFGKVYKAKDILAGTGAIDAGVKHTEVYTGGVTSHDPQPTRHLPELLNITVFTGEELPKSGQTWLPFHSLFRFPLLSSKGPRSGLSTGKLFSQMIGMPMIIKYRET